MDKIYIGSANIAPLGEVWVAVTEKGLFRLQFPSTAEKFKAVVSKDTSAQLVWDEKQTNPVLKQLQEYAAGRRKDFTLQIDWTDVGDFQRLALEATALIPYGATATYKQIAEKAGKPNGARAAGRAEATNRVPLVIPCHRVLGSDGKLHGYGAGNGLATKEWLLKHEKENLKTG